MLFQIVLHSIQTTVQALVSIVLRIELWKNSLGSEVTTESVRYCNTYNIK